MAATCHIIIYDKRELNGLIKAKKSALCKGFETMIDVMTKQKSKSPASGVGGAIRRG